MFVIRGGCSVCLATHFQLRGAHTFWLHVVGSLPPRVLVGAGVVACMGFSSCGERSVQRQTTNGLSPFDPALVTSENNWLHLLFIPGGAALRAFQYWGRSAPTGLAACNSLGGAGVVAECAFPAKGGTAFVCGTCFTALVGVGVVGCMCCPTIGAQVGFIRGGAEFVWLFVI